MFDRGETVAYAQADRLWAEPVEIGVYEGWVGISRGGGEGVMDRVRLVLAVNEVTPEVGERLVQHLVNVDSAVPSWVRRDALGTIAVECLEPSSVRSLEAVWVVSDRLRVVWRYTGRAFLAPDQDGDGGDEFIDLCAPDAWRLACALAAVKAWGHRVGERQRCAGRDLLREVASGADGAEVQALEQSRA